MADIAVTFHWTPDAMDRMPLSELLHWRYQALIRSGAKEHE
ncbi:GpE family phage tail protein [Serratia ureilytica]|uniref:GpE family phage tail protein n=1 Tax=Serratia ureilytica TaxID=300181 RepID=A0A9X9G1K6_9GAMM|nr:GpE family phage tail protein [Serratia ureilytica]TXE26940.1 GpE family phage tail protein [Serratia ureilytica]